MCWGSWKRSTSGLCVSASLGKYHIWERCCGTLAHDVTRGCASVMWQGALVIFRVRWATMGQKPLHWKPFTGDSLWKQADGLMMWKSSSPIILVDIISLLFFIVHIPISILIDGQACELLKWLGWPLCCDGVLLILMPMLIQSVNGCWERLNENSKAGLMGFWVVWMIADG